MGADSTRIPDEEKVEIVGISGWPRSGKDGLAELFMQDGYFGVSFGDIIRMFTHERHADKPDPISVANMTETANWLRNTHGADVVLREALRRFSEARDAGSRYRGLVLWSIRAPVEADFILERGGDLIWIEASAQVRHERALKHLRPGEAATTLEEFKRQEALQLHPRKTPGVPPEAQMNMSYVKEHATHTLVNNSDSFESFLQDAEKLIESLDQ